MPPTSEKLPLIGVTVNYMFECLNNVYRRHCQLPNISSSIANYQIVQLSPITKYIITMPASLPFAILIFSFSITTVSYGADCHHFAPNTSEAVSDGFQLDPSTVNVTHQSAPVFYNVGVPSKLIPFSSWLPVIATHSPSCSTFLRCLHPIKIDTLIK